MSSSKSKKIYNTNKDSLYGGDDVEFDNADFYNEFDGEDNDVVGGATDDDITDSDLDYSEETCSDSDEEVMNIFSETENYTLNIVDPSERITSNLICKEELTALISTRAAQISNGMQPLVDLKPNDNSKLIAIREIKQGKLPLKIIRKVGESIEIWKVNELSYDVNLLPKN